MATIGELAVNIVANTRGLSRGSRKARKEFKRISTAAKKTLLTIRNVGIGLTGIGAVGVVAGIKQTASELDNLAKTASKLGIASKELASLRHAAELTGVSSNTLDMALQRMTRRVAEAAKGTGEAVKALKELGIEASSFMQLPMGKQMDLLADAMGRVDTQADKIRLSMKLFDSEGVALVNTLKLGSSGLAKMREEAERLGIAIDEKALAKVEEMNDAMTRLQAAFGGLMGQLVIAISPGLSKAVNQMEAAVVTMTADKIQNKDPSQAGAVARGAFFRDMMDQSNFIAEKAGGGIGGRAAGLLNFANPLAWMAARERTGSAFDRSGMYDAGKFGGGPQMVAGVDVSQPFSPTVGNSINESRAAEAKANGGAFFKGAVNILRSAGPKIAGMAGGVIGAGASIAGISANALGAAGLVGMRDSVRSQQALAGETQQPKGGPQYNNILERGTSEAFREARRNLQPSDPTEKYAKKAEQQRDSMITVLEEAAGALIGLEVARL